VKAYAQVSSSHSPVQASTLGIQEDDLNFYIHLDLSGVIKKDLNIEIEDSESGIFTSRNNKFGSKFEHHFDINSSITFVDLVLEETVYAKLENGVLEVTLPKVQNPKAHFVQIQWFLIF